MTNPKKKLYERALKPVSRSSMMSLNPDMLMDTRPMLAKQIGGGASQ